MSVLENRLKIEVDKLRNIIESARMKNFSPCDEECSEILRNLINLPPTYEEFNRFILQYYQREKI